MCSVGSVASGHTVSVPCMSVAGYVRNLCRRLSSIAHLCDGAHFGRHVLFNKKMGVFLKHMIYNIYQDIVAILCIHVVKILNWVV